jgi:hypothetical protein
MARQFSFPLVVRLIPDDLFRQILKALNITLKLPAGRKRTDLEAAVTAIQGLPRAGFDALEAVLRPIHELAERDGPTVLFQADAETGKGDLAKHVPDGVSSHYLAAWAWVNRRRVFQKAAAFGEFDRIRTWRRRADLPDQPPDVSKPTLKRLGQAIAKILVATQARGRKCTVEALTRGRVTYVYVHADDYARVDLVHDAKGRRVPRTYRPTFEVVFAYEPAARTLETAADVSPKTKDHLDAAFAAACLDWDLGPCPKGPMYLLNGLLDPDFEFAPDPGDGLIMKLRKVSLGFPASNRVIELKNDRKVDLDMRPLYACLDPRRVALDELWVKSARLEAAFDGTGESKEGSVTFYLSPKTCSLPDQPEVRVEAIQRCLRDSGLINVGSRV